LDIIHQVFIDHVKKTRQKTLKAKNFDNIFNGSTWIGKQAIEMGLADEVQSIESFIRETYGGPNHINMFIYTIKLKLIPMIPGGAPQMKQNFEKDSVSYKKFKIGQDQEMIVDEEKFERYNALLNTIEKYERKIGTNEIDDFRSAIQSILKKCRIV